jgi:hypothetical protein
LLVKNTNKGKELLDELKENTNKGEKDNNKTTPASCGNHRSLNPDSHREEGNFRSRFSSIFMGKKFLPFFLREGGSAFWPRRKGWVMIK